MWYFKKRRVKLFIIMTIVVAVLTLIGLATTAQVVDSLRYTHVTSSLVGAWRGEKGNVFELRPDGTGRGRANDDADTVSFRWNERESTLSLFFEPKQKSLVQKTEQMLRGLPECAMSNYRIDWADDGALQLYDSTHNTSLFFTRTNDEAFVLNRSPSKSGNGTELGAGSDGG